MWRMAVNATIARFTGLMVVNSVKLLPNFIMTLKAFFNTDNAPLIMTVRTITLVWLMENIAHQSRTVTTMGVMTG